MVERRAWRRVVRGAVLLAAAVSLSACGDLAEGGPIAEAVTRGSSPTLSYRLVPITAATLAAVTEAEPDHLAGTFPANRSPKRIVLGIGDILSIAVYEAAVGGLFVPGESGSVSSNSVNLPNQAVDVAGNISFPFGGAIRAAGRTPQQVQAAILDRIKNRAIDPQVIVTVVSQLTSLVSVEGEVKAPTRYPAAASGARDRISDAVTRAGGLLGPGWDSFISLERDGRRTTVPFESLLSGPAEDIFVQPGDRILVTQEPQRFIALGALGRRAPTGSDTEAAQGRVAALLDGGRAEIPFDSWRLSLAAAVAKAGGLLDVRADAGSVFLYRREPARVAHRLGLDSGPLDGMPVIYRLDLSDPAGFLLATRFPMRNDDVLYVANARAVEITKALDYVGTYLSTAVNASTAALVANAALNRSRTTGLPTIGGLTVVPSGVTGQPGTITPGGLINGVATTTTPTGGTGDGGGTAGTGMPATRTTAADAAATTLQTPRSTMASPASR